MNYDNLTYEEKTEALNIVSHLLENEEIEREGYGDKWYLAREIDLMTQFRIKEPKEYKGKY